MIDVAVGIILKDKSVFLAKRSNDKHQGGLWEFPGGKCEADESPSNALTRELIEEIGITPIAVEPFDLVTHHYGDKEVRLHFFLVTSFSGEENGVEGQQVRWVQVKDLIEYEFPAANTAIVEKLVAQYSN